MPKEQLTRLLDQLKEELARADALDPGARARLEELRSRIETTLASGVLTEAQADRPLREHLQQHIDQFETSHPQLTMKLGRIADLLNKLGI